MHKLGIVTAYGLTIVRGVNLAAGTSSSPYLQADLLADFGGTAPASFQVRVFARQRGNRSNTLAQLVTMSPATPANPVPRTNWMYPSLMSQILGACDPETLADRNFALIAAHFGLMLPATASQG